MRKKQGFSGEKKLAQKFPNREHQNRAVSPHLPLPKPYGFSNQPGCLPEDLLCDFHKDLYASKSKDDLTCDTWLRTVMSNTAQGATDDDHKDWNHGWHWKPRSGGNIQCHSRIKPPSKDENSAPPFSRDQLWILNNHLTHLGFCGFAFQTTQVDGILRPAPHWTFVIIQQNDTCKCILQRAK